MENLQENDDMFDDLEKDDVGLSKSKIKKVQTKGTKNLQKVGAKKAKKLLPGDEEEDDDEYQESSAKSEKELNRR